MTSRPIVTNMNNANPNQPSTIAAVPTPLFTLPFPKSWAICEAATDAVCCHNTDTRTKIEAMKMSASATCETGRDGNGLTSISDPVLPSCSSCHPGNVARSRKVMKARTMAMILRWRLAEVKRYVGLLMTYSKYGKTTSSLKVLAIQIKLRGSWSMLTCSASNVALFEHRNDPPSGLMQRPKYPTLTSSIA